MRKAFFAGSPDQRERINIHRFVTLGILELALRVVSDGPVE